jgi:hypothetical protein
MKIHNNALKVIKAAVFAMLCFAGSSSANAAIACGMQTTGIKVNVGTAAAPTYASQNIMVFMTFSASNAVADDHTCDQIISGIVDGIKAKAGTLPDISLWTQARKIQGPNANYPLSTNWAYPAAMVPSTAGVLHYYDAVYTNIENDVCCVMKAQTIVSNTFPNGQVLTWINL